MRYVDFMQAHVFQPLGLRDIFHSPFAYEDLTPLDSKRYTYFTPGETPYSTSDFDGSRVYGAYHLGIGRTDLSAPTGSWVATARDLVRLMCGTDRLASPSDLLAPATLDEMERVPYPTLKRDQAHAWNKNSLGKVAKPGAMEVGAAYMAKFPSGINVAIVINTGASSSALRDMATAVHDIIENAAIPPGYDLFAGAFEASHPSSRP